MPVRLRTRSGEVFCEQSKSYFEIAATTVIALIVMTAGSALVVIDTLIKHHAHIHQHTFTHTHDGTTHTHTVTHTHGHDHYMTDDRHGHRHTKAELEKLPDASH